MNIAKKILIVLGAGIGVILLIAIILASFFSRQVGQLVIKELKKSLKTELTVGNMSLSLVRHFPKASIQLKNVALKDATKTNHLFKAQEVSFQFNVLSLFTGKYKIESVNIIEGSSMVWIDDKGKTNYDIFKPTNSSSSKNDLAFSLKEANIQKFAVSYLDEKTKQNLSMYIETMLLGGDFEKKRFQMNSKAKLKMDYLIVEGIQYLPSIPIEYNIDFEIDREKNVFSFNQDKLTIDGNVFSLNGKVSMPQDATLYDLKFKVENGSVSSILNLLPAQYHQSIEGWESDGDFVFEGSLIGKQTAIEQPVLSFTSSLKNGFLKHPLLPEKIKNVNFNIEFSNLETPERPSYLNIPNFKANIGEEAVEVALQVLHVQDPEISVVAAGALDISVVYPFISDFTTEGEGRIVFSDWEIEGKYADMLNTNTIQQVNATGSLRFDNVRLKRKGDKLLIDGEIKLSNNDVFIEKLHFEGPQTNLDIIAEAKNWLPVLVADSLNTQASFLEFHTTLRAEKMDFDKMLPLLADELKDSLQINKDKLSDTTRISKKDAATSKSLIHYLKGNTVLEVKEFNYRKIKGKNFVANMDLQGNKLEIKQMQADAIGGNWAIHARAKKLDTSPEIEAFIEGQKVNAQELFTQCENFGQTVLTDKHIRGTLNMLVKINAYWDEKGSFDDKRLTAVADADLTDGELLGFDMLNSFSTYIKLQDLKHIKFTHLQNQFEIKNRTFIMPAMFIQSNALNLIIGGKHSFDHDMDYKIKINAGQVMMNKLKKHNPSLKPVAAKKKGLFNIYARIVGNLYKDYETKIGKKHVGTELDKELNRQQAHIQNTLKHEFEKEASVEGIGETEDEADGKTDE